jgi:hypothetical protein
VKEWINCHHTRPLLAQKKGMTNTSGNGGQPQQNTKKRAMIKKVSSILSCGLYQSRPDSPKLDVLFNVNQWSNIYPSNMQAFAHAVQTNYLPVN